MQKSIHQSRKLNAESSLQDLLSISIPSPQSVWCADLTEDLSGVVNSIDVPGEEGGPLIIYPGSQDNPIIADRGLLCPRNWMTPAQAYFNAAILPGIQRYNPNFRVGQIVSIDGDFANVSLDSSFSSAQDLNVNNQSTLMNVPIQYMTCNGGAFEEGDRVVVEFVEHDQSKPRVIGFESNPRPCAVIDAYLAFENNSVIKLFQADTYSMATREQSSLHGGWPFRNNFAIHGGNHWTHYSNFARESVIVKNGSIVNNLGTAYRFADACLCASKDFLWIATPDEEYNNLYLLKCDTVTGAIISTLTVPINDGTSVAGMAATKDWIHFWADGFNNGAYHVRYNIQSGAFFIESWLYSNGPVPFSAQSASAFGGEISFVVNVGNPSPTFYTEIWVLQEGAGIESSLKIPHNAATQPTRFRGCGVTPDYLICTFANNSDVQIYNRASGFWSSVGANPSGASGGSVVFDPVYSI